MVMMFPTEREAELRQQLVEKGFTISDAPYAFWRARSPECTITFFDSGKLVIQGREADTWVELLRPSHSSGELPGCFGLALAKHPAEAVNSWIGTDESGKGDYFGPLVVVAFSTRHEQLPLLAELGVADSKTLSDQQAIRIAADLEAIGQHTRITISPQRYNELWRRSGRNLNKLLAWAHARAIENLLERDDTPGLVVVDKFGPDERITMAMMELGKGLRLVQRPRAEDDPAVAAASIIARAHFISSLGRLSQKWSLKLPKGAGEPVLAAGRTFLARHGRESLEKVAKTHFKTTASL